MDKKEVKLDMEFKAVPFIPKGKKNIEEPPKKEEKNKSQRPLIISHQRYSIYR